MRGRTVLAGVLLAAAGGVGVLAFPRGDASVTATAHGYVNDDRPDTLNAHNSPAATASPSDPSTIVLADRIDTPLFGCTVASTADGGTTWRQVPLPLPAEAPNCYWPDVAWNAQGQSLVLYGATGGPNNQPVGTWVQRYDGDEPVGPPAAVTGAHAFHPRLAADGDRVVATWIAAGPNTSARRLGLAPEPNPVVVAVSTDGGTTFDQPVEVGDRDRLAVVPAVVVDGDTVVVAALDLVDDEADYSGLHDAIGGPAPDGTWQIVAWTSTDGGASFAGAVVVADVVIPQRIHVDLGPPRPGLAMDRRTGRLYVTWESGRGTARDVFVARSDDAGATWSDPQAIARPGTQTVSAVDVAPEGRVDVVFYDRGGDPADVQAEVVQASSWDGGRTFTATTVSRQPFDSRIGLGGFQNLAVLGTQTDVVAGREGSVVLWSDTARATRDDNRQDLGVALVRVEPDPGANGALVAMSGALAGVGLANLVRWRRPATEVGTETDTGP